MGICRDGVNRHFARRSEPLVVTLQIDNHLVLASHALTPTSAACTRSTVVRPKPSFA
jgi:hypothetical protein